jgi:hypothetical protein
MTNDEVSSTVYELLVGTAAVRLGRSIEMLAPEKHRRTPDFRIHDLGVPASVECKRRLGLSEYEHNEALHVQTLYEAIREQISDRHLSIEASFDQETRFVGPVEFSAAVELLLKPHGDQGSVSTAWGGLSFRTLPYTLDLSRTRLFSPDYLHKVFGWRDAAEWDGLSCEVDAADSIFVRRVKGPRCLKWVSRSPTAILKKSRGVTTLWGRATQQISGGDLGFVYIAYPEGGRSIVADARTREIREACSRWFHRWSILVGATLVNRLYPRALGIGMPDLIESTMPIVEEHSEHLLGSMPSCVFVHPRKPRGGSRALVPSPLVR